MLHRMLLILYHSNRNRLQAAKTKAICYSDICWGRHTCCTPTGQGIFPFLFCHSLSVFLTAVLINKKKRAAFFMSKPVTSRGCNLNNTNESAEIWTVLIEKEQEKAKAWKGGSVMRKIGMGRGMDRSQRKKEWHQVWFRGCEVAGKP